MNTTATQQHRRLISRSSRMYPFARGFLDGMAGMFDIFGVDVQPRKRRTTQDDARNLHRDIERIADDFRTVFSKIGSIPPK